MDLLLCSFTEINKRYVYALEVSFGIPKTDRRYEMFKNKFDNSI
jgi:hypothetical protein